MMTPWGNWNPRWFYLSILIIVFSQGFKFTRAQNEITPNPEPAPVPETETEPETEPEPQVIGASKYDVRLKVAFFDSTGVEKRNYNSVIAFGPGFENVLEKDAENHPQGRDERRERRKLELDRMIHMSVPQLIQNGGNYRWKEHVVTTEDDYILSVFQIMKTRECSRTLPVLLMHDFLGSAADWLMVDPEDALPFFLVDKGFEVWLLNARGNEYSNRHQHYKITEPKFWNFSFHEQGKYDMPKVIELVQNQTETQAMYEPRKKKISFVGSGMGNTVFYVYLSLYGDKAKRKVYSLTSVTPTAFLSRTASPLRLFHVLANDYVPFNKDGPLTPPILAKFLHYVVPELCPFHFLSNVSLCVSAGFLRTSDYSMDLTTRIMRRVFGHYPSTTSIRTFLHYVQVAAEDKFKQFDFGALKNFAGYRQLTPPHYNLFNVEVSSVNLYGQKDITVDYRDVERTTSEVGVTMFQANFMVLDDFTNVDFMYGTVGTHITRVAVLASLKPRLCVRAFSENKACSVPNFDIVPLKRVTLAKPPPTQREQCAKTCCFEV